MFTFLIPAFGAVGGALMNKKNPLQGALLGGGLAAFAAPAIGGLGGLGGTQQASMLAAQEAGLGTSSLGWGGATTGMQGLLNSAGGANGLLKTAGNAANTAAAVKGLMPQDQPMPVAPPFQPAANPTLSNMYQSMQSNRLAQLQNDAAAKAQRQQRIRLLG